MNPHYLSAWLLVAVCFTTGHVGYTCWGQITEADIAKIMDDPELNPQAKHEMLAFVAENDVEALVIYTESNLEKWAILFPVLGESKSARATSILLEALDRGDMYLEALPALKKIGDPDSRESILMVMRDEVSPIDKRLLAADAIARIGTDAQILKAERFLIAISSLRLTDALQFEKELLWSGFIEVGSERALEHIAAELELVAQPDEISRLLDMLACAGVFSDTLIDTLLGAVIHEDWMIENRYEAAIAIHTLDTSRTTLKRLLESSSALYLSATLQGANEETLAKIQDAIASVSEALTLSNAD